MERMIDEAEIREGSYIAVLPMSSEEPDSAFLFIRQDIEQVSDIPCINLNFVENDLINQPKLDSLKNASIVFITGGDQSRFMRLVHDTPIEDAIIEAFHNGAVIAGTSAGAAVMSKVMISGEENFSPEYQATYDKLWKENAIYNHGIGLLNNVIVDQHFVVRSRHNRLLSAICDYPGMYGLGIDEETAAIVKDQVITVAGENQVILFHPKDTCTLQMHRIGVRDLHMDVLLPGDTVVIPNLALR